MVVILIKNACFAIDDSLPSQALQHAAIELISSNITAVTATAAFLRASLRKHISTYRISARKGGHLRSSKHARHGNT